MAHFLPNVGGHKFGLIIWPFSLELTMLVAETGFSLRYCAKEEKQPLKLIRPLVPCFLAVYFLKA